MMATNILLVVVLSFMPRDILWTVLIAINARLFVLKSSFCRRSAVDIEKSCPAKRCCCPYYYYYQLGLSIETTREAHSIIRIQELNYYRYKYLQNKRNTITKSKSSTGQAQRQTGVSLFYLILPSLSSSSSSSSSTTPTLLSERERARERATSNLFLFS